MSVTAIYTETAINYAINGRVAMTYWNGHQPLDMVTPTITIQGGVIRATGLSGAGVMYTCELTAGGRTGTMRGSVPVLRIGGTPISR